MCNAAKEYCVLTNGSADCLSGGYAPLAYCMQGAPSNGCTCSGDCTVGVFCK
jgi:hypothetical protein